MVGRLVDLSRNEGRDRIILCEANERRKIQPDGLDGFGDWSIPILINLLCSAVHRVLHERVVFQRDRWSVGTLGTAAFGKRSRSHPDLLGKVLTYIAMCAGQVKA